MGQTPNLEDRELPQRLSLPRQPRGKVPSDWIRVPFSLDPSVAVDTFLSPWSEAWEVKRTDHLDPGIFKDTFNFILPPNLEIFIDQIKKKCMC